MRLKGFAVPALCGIVVGVTWALLSMAFNPAAPEAVSARSEEPRSEAAAPVRRDRAGIEPGAAAPDTRPAGATDFERDLLDAELRQATATDARIEVDADMQLDQVYTARLWAEKVPDGAPSAELDRQTAATPEPTQYSGTVPTTHFLTAAAIFAGERLVPETEPRQVATSDRPAYWEWRIQPKREGANKLIISLRHEVELNGVTHSLVVKEFPRTITVSVGAMGRAKRMIGGSVEALGIDTIIQSTIAAVLGAFFVGRMRERRAVRRGDGSAADPGGETQPSAGSGVGNVVAPTTTRTPAAAPLAMPGPEATADIRVIGRPEQS